MFSTSHKVKILDTMDQFAFQRSASQRVMTACLSSQSAPRRVETPGCKAMANPNPRPECPTEGCNQQSAADHYVIVNRNTSKQEGTQEHERNFVLRA